MTADSSPKPPGQPGFKRREMTAVLQIEAGGLLTQAFECLEKAADLTRLDSKPLELALFRGIQCHGQPLTSPAPQGQEDGGAADQKHHAGGARAGGQRKREREAKQQVNPALSAQGDQS